jgi:hypothetical protein
VESQVRRIGERVREGDAGTGRAGDRGWPAATQTQSKITHSFLNRVHDNTRIRDEASMLRYRGPRHHCANVLDSLRGAGRLLQRDGVAERWAFSGPARLVQHRRLLSHARATRTSRNTPTSLYPPRASSFLFILRIAVEPRAAPSS